MIVEPIGVSVSGSYLYTIPCLLDREQVHLGTEAPSSASPGIFSTVAAQRSVQDNPENSSR